MAEPFKKDWCELIFNESIDPILIFDTKTMKVVDLNPATEKALERTRDEIIGKNPLSFVPKERILEYLGLIREHVTKGGVTEMKVYFKTKSGKTIPSFLTSYVINPDGNKFYVGIFHISEKIDRISKED